MNMRHLNGWLHRAMVVADRNGGDHYWDQEVRARRPAARPRAPARTVAPRPNPQPLSIPAAPRPPFWRPGVSTPRPPAQGFWWTLRRMTDHAVDMVYRMDGTVTASRTAALPFETDFYLRSNGGVQVRSQHAVVRVVGLPRQRLAPNNG